MSMKIITKNLLFILCFTACINAQGVEPIDIIEVNVEGNESVSPRVIKHTAGLVDSSSIIPGDFSKSVKRLWSTGLFSDIQILLDEETSDGIYITIHVVENPILGKLQFSGNKKKKAKDFEEELSLITGQRIQPHIPKESEEKIKGLYYEDGYLSVDIRSELVDTKIENVKDIHFHITENKKVKIKKIEFTGNEIFSDRKLRKILKDTKIQKWYFFWRSFFVEKEFDEDKKLLSSFYRNEGYYDFMIVSDSIHYDEDGRRMKIEIEVYEGPKYYIRNISWEGNLLADEDQLMYRVGLRKGDVFNEEKFNLAIYDRVQGIYMDKGYIYSQITPEIVPIGEDSLDVHFVISEGQQVAIRQIDIWGNTKTRENVIRRELKLYPGDIFNRELLIRSARELMILNYFSNVEPNVVPVDEDEVDLTFTVEEKSSDRATASVGFTGVYGLTGGVGLEFNNFLGKGQQINLSFQEGTQYRVLSNNQASKYRSFSMSFTDPMINDTPNLVGFSLYYYLRGQGAYSYSIPLDREIFGSSVRLGRRLRWPDNYFRATWVVQGSKKKYSGDEEILEEYVSGFEETNGLSVSQHIRRDSRNHPEFPSLGSVMNWTSTFSGGILGGHENFHKNELKLDWYSPLFWKFVLTTSLQMGAIKETPSKSGSRSVIPLDEKFIMGGTGIPYGTLMRGYIDNTVGPYSNGPLGGLVKLKYMVELRFPFSENPTMYGLLFAEMGNVWKDFSRTDPYELKRSAGVGIRMFMPMIGMLGFDYGYGFDDVDADLDSEPQGWNFHILFGMPF